MQEEQKKQRPLPKEGFVRLAQILAHIPVGKSTWWAGCKTGRFPKPIKLGPRTTVWRVEEIKAFIDNTGIQWQVDDHE